jgi:hypothetical protein
MEMTISMIHKEDSEDIVQCLECGRWYKTISRTHAELIHGISQAEYMKKYNLITIASALSRMKMSLSSKIWTERDEQLLKKIARKMTLPEIACQFNLAQSTIRGRLRLMGIKAKPKPRQTKWTKNLILNKVKEYNRKGVPLNVARMTRCDQPLVLMARYHFGSWQDTLEEAGFNYNKVRIHQRWTKEKVIQSIRQLKEERIRLTYVAMREANMCLLQATRTHFGTRAEAVGKQKLERSNLF